MLIKRPLWIIVLFFFFNLFQPLPVDFEQVIATSHTTGFELSNVVEG